MVPTFYELKDFPEIAELASNWETMRDEYKALTAGLLPIDRINKAHDEALQDLLAHMRAGGDYGWFQGWGNGDLPNPHWTQYALTFYDHPVPFAETPLTKGLLSKIRGIKTASFIRMDPHTILPIHTHPELLEEGLLQMHVTLEGPDQGAYLVVDGEVRPHVVGETHIFDGYFAHTAFNASPQLRTILYLEFDKALHYRLNKDA